MAPQWLKNNSRSPIDHKTGGQCVHLKAGRQAGGFLGPASLLFGSLLVERLTAKDMRFRFHAGRLHHVAHFVRQRLAVHRLVFGRADKLPDPFAGECADDGL